MPAGSLPSNMEVPQPLEVSEKNDNSGSYSSARNSLGLNDSPNNYDAHNMLGKSPTIMSVLRTLPSGKTCGPARGSKSGGSGKKRGVTNPILSTSITNLNREKEEPGQTGNKGEEDDLLFGPFSLENDNAEQFLAGDNTNTLDMFNLSL